MFWYVFWETRKTNAFRCQPRYNVGEWLTDAGRLRLNHFSGPFDSDGWWLHCKDLAIRRTAFLPYVKKKALVTPKLICVRRTNHVNVLRKVPTEVKKLYVLKKNNRSVDRYDRSCRMTSSETFVPFVIFIILAVRLRNHAKTIHRCSTRAFRRKNAPVRRGNWLGETVDKIPPINNFEISQKRHFFVLYFFFFFLLKPNGLCKHLKSVSETRPFWRRVLHVFEFVELPFTRPSRFNKYEHCSRAGSDDDDV